MQIYELAGRSKEMIPLPEKIILHSWNCMMIYKAFWEHISDSLKLLSVLSKKIRL